jgi:hypothetical protein
MLSHSDLKRYERKLRVNDNAIRVRQSMEGPTILVERKTFRGQVGSVGPEGIVWSPDAGFRRENGHVPVCSIPIPMFDFTTLRDSLQASDTWRRWDRGARPLSEQADERDRLRKAKQVSERKAGLRYKASELYDRYAWREKSRVRVLENLQ